MKTKTLLLLSLLATMQFLLQYQTFGQCPTTPINIQLPTGVLNTRIIKFKNEKLGVLNKHMTGTSQHPPGILDINVENFFNMLDKICSRGDGVRIYFGAYCNSTIGPDDPYAVGKDNILVPIFVPTVANMGYQQDVVPEYYILDETDQKGYRLIRQSIARDWVNNFRNTLLLELSATLPPSRNGNDNRSLWYNKADLLNWKKDIIDCQKPSHPEITTISLLWGVFEKDGNFIQANGSVKQLNVTGLLTMLFQIPKASVQTKAQKEALFLKAKKNGIKLKSIVADYDTGVPCPPGDNCDLGNSL